jgi:8-amino-7-oxononanoate synthase
MSGGGRNLELRLRAALQARDEDGLLRTLRAPGGIDLSSNDYLGLSDHPLIKQAMIAAVEQEGCGSTGSRLLRGHRTLFDQVEGECAAFKQASAALYFSSGYLANIAVLSTLAQRGDRILSDRHNHASLRDGIRLSHARHIVFPHNDLAALTRLLDDSRGPGTTFVVTESLFSMDGDTPPLEDYAAACRRAGATLIVDEAHAVGVYGTRGSGRVEACGLDPDDLVSINTAGKALGVAGAFVAGPAWAMAYLMQCARPFVFSTAPPPAVAAALAASLTLIVNEPERRRRLFELAAYCRQRLTAAGVTVASGTSPIIPVVVGGSDRALAIAGQMQRQGFDVRAIRPPTVPAGTARLRLSVNVRLTEDVIDAAVEALASALAMWGPLRMPGPSPRDEGAASLGAEARSAQAAGGPMRSQ